MNRGKRSFKFLLDSDALIKLCKCKVLTVVTQGFSYTISEIVYIETVKKGMEKLYEDAFEIQQLVKDGLISVKKTIELQGNEDIGKGESSVLALFKRGGYDAIISDDRTFLRKLDSNGIPYLIPADIIVLLYRVKEITRKGAFAYLQELRYLTSEEAYFEAEQKLGGKK